MFCFITAIAGEDDSKYQKFLKPSLPNGAVSFVMGGSDSIAKKYNDGIKKYLELPDRTPDDVICFVHDDVKIVDKFFTDKLSLFFANPHFSDVAIAGVIGSLVVGSGCFWWEYPEYTKGVVVQYYRDPHKPPTLSKGVEPITISQVLTVDGLAMFATARHLSEIKFDESFGGYHFYDLDTCTDLAYKNLRVFVLNVVLEHHSEGDSPTSKAFMEARQHYINKHKFPKFPIKVKQKHGKQDS